MRNDAFGPDTQNTTTISVTNASSATQFDTTLSSTTLVSKQVRIWNSGSKTAYVQFGVDSTVTATTSKMPIPAGNTEVFSVPGAGGWIGAITGGTDTTTLYVTPGRGI